MVGGFLGAYLGGTIFEATGSYDWVWYIDIVLAAGAALVASTSSDAARVRCLAYRAQGATLLWLANLTAQAQVVRVAHQGSEPFGIVLDEASFERATLQPAAFQAAVVACGSIIAWHWSGVV